MASLYFCQIGLEIPKRRFQNGFDKTQVLSLRSYNLYCLLRSSFVQPSLPVCLHQPKLMLLPQAHSYSLPTFLWMCLQKQFVVCEECGGLQATASNRNIGTPPPPLDFCIIEFQCIWCLIATFSSSSIFWPKFLSRTPCRAQCFNILQWVHSGSM